MVTVSSLQSIRSFSDWRELLGLVEEEAAETAPGTCAVVEEEMLAVVVAAGA